MRILVHCKRTKLGRKMRVEILQRMSAMLWWVGASGNSNYVARLASDCGAHILSHAACKDWCPSTKQEWSEKCAWAACSGCRECSGAWRLVCVACGSTEHLHPYILARHSYLHVNLGRGEPITAPNIALVTVTSPTSVTTTTITSISITTTTITSTSVASTVTSTMVTSSISPSTLTRRSRHK